MFYISKEKDIVNTEPENEYFQTVNTLINQWDSGQQIFELKTSGSTGKPKIILVNRNQIEASVSMTQNALKLNGEELFFCCLNVNYIAGMMMVFRALHIGAELLVTEPTSNPLESLGNLEYLLKKKNGKVFYSFVPLQLQSVLKNENTASLLKFGKHIIVGGAAIGKSLKQQIIEANLPVFETYGMTETISHIALKNVLANHDYFTAIDGVNIETNTNDCLRINSLSTDNDWVQTNDVVEMVGKGHFILKGRIDNIINSGGIKIQLEEIERKLADHFEWPFRYFCFGKNDEKLGQKLALLIEHTDKIVEVSDLNSIFSKYEAPKDVYFLKEFIETATGKVDKIKTINLLSAY